MCQEFQEDLTHVLSKTVHVISDVIVRASMIGLSANYWTVFRLWNIWF